MIKLNGHPINVTMFPDKTSQVWKLQGLENAKNHQVEWDFEHEGEFMHLAQLKCLLDSYGANSITLHLSYLPYARQDKLVSNETTFALEPFASLLNSLDFDVVFILDPHSPEALSLIHNSRATKPDERIEILLLELTARACYPDEGASKRYSNRSFEIIMEKVRDQSTGRITDLYTKAPSSSIAGHDFLIIDDICDGGTTFVQAAEELYRLGAANVYLYVTHGIFSQGLKVLMDAGIKRIFTYDKEVTNVVQ